MNAAPWLDEVAIVAVRDPAAALRRLLELDVLIAAQEDPAIAVAVLRTFAALAWRIPDARLALIKLREWPATRAVARWRDRVEHDLAAAAEYHAAYKPVLPPYMLDLIADAGLADPAERRATAAAVLRELQADPLHYLDSFDTLDTRCFDLSEQLTVRVLDDVALERRELDVLPPALAGELGRRLTKLGGRLATMLVTLVGAAGLAAGLGVAILVEPGLGMLAGGSTMFGAGGLRGQAYRRGVRKELARIVADLGVTRACLREAMRRRGGRLSGFANPLGNDRPMRLLGMLAAAAHSVAEPDDDAPT